MDEVIENSLEEEQRIPDIYEATPVHEFDSDPDNIHDLPVISYKTALEGLEALRLFRLQNPHVPSQKAEQLEGLLVISRKRGY